MILQSKMNYNSFGSGNFLIAKNYLNSLDFNKWIGIDNVPSIIIAEVLILIDEGFSTERKAEFDEFYERFKIIKVSCFELSEMSYNHLIMNTENGIFYHTYDEALDSIGNIFSQGHFYKMLNGYHPNKTNLINV